MGLSDGRHNIFTAKEIGKAHIHDKIRQALGVHQVAVSAQRKRHKAQLVHFILYSAQLFEALVRKYVLCPALGGRQFHIMEASRRNALQCIFNGIPMIAV